MKPINTTKLLDICIAMSSEKDRNGLLERILTAAMDITHCDGGTLYIKSGHALTFRFMITKSLNIRKGGVYGEIDLPSVPISRTNVCTCALLEGKLINLPDVYASNCFDFSGPRQYDAMTGYKTTSMLVLPMQDDTGKIIGVLQLINALDEEGNTIPFHTTTEPVILALASQAAVCLTNMNYASAVQALLDSLVSVLSTAIDSRTPYNANHTRNMARYAERFLDWLNKQQTNWLFTESEKRQFIMSVWLHDVGKLTTPLHVMDKESRLSEGLERVLTRFTTIGLLERIRAMEEGTDSSSLEETIHNARALVVQVNTIPFVTDDMLAGIQDLGQRSYLDEKGKLQPWLRRDEVINLSVRKGTLTEAERLIMQAHVSMTSKILSEIRFTDEYKKVPLWATMHHEFLNGNGYPAQLKGDDIPRETRLLTILDIFDALTAKDRPYKAPMPLDKAIHTLENMVQEGQLDGEILALFIKSRAWEDKE